MVNILCEVSKIKIRLVEVEKTICFHLSNCDYIILGVKFTRH